MFFSPFFAEHFVLIKNQVRLEKWTTSGDGDDGYSGSKFHNELVVHYRVTGNLEDTINFYPKALQDESQQIEPMDTSHFIPLLNADGALPLTLPDTDVEFQSLALFAKDETVIKWRINFGKG